MFGTKITKTAQLLVITESRLGPRDWKAEVGRQ